MTLGTLGLLHPGGMGVTVGKAAALSGAPVVWASEGRSETTRVRAGSCGFADRSSLAAVVAESAIIVSVCPPHAALTLAEQVASKGFDGIYLDANAVAPATARQIGQVVDSAGARFVDGGIIGPPALVRGTTRLYLSGEHAEAVLPYFTDSPLEAIAIGRKRSAASALKMSYAAYTKGNTALLLAVRALAAAEGVDGPLLEEWSISQPELGERSARAARATAPKAWRFSGEMTEIAETFRAAGLPAGFHEAASELYQRMAVFKDAPEPPDIDGVIAALLERDE